VSAIAPARDAAPARPLALARPRAAEVAAVCCLVAGAIHLAVLPDHASEWWAYGAFFAGCAVWQTVFGLLVWSGRRPQWLLLVGLASLLAVLVLYVLSRTNGVPLGPHAGRPEPAGALDLICAGSELGAIVAVLQLLPPVTARRALSGLGLAGAALWTARGTGLLL
jgi:hypothetical protein